MAGKTLHNHALVIDLHSDFPVDLVRRKRNGEQNVLEYRWLPRLKAGGVDAAVLICGGDTYSSGHTMEDVLETIEYIKQEVEKSSSIVIAECANDVMRAKNEGKVSIILGLEGAGPLGERLTNVEILYRLGLRLVQLTWDGRNMVADGVAEDATGGGLSKFGIELVETLHSLGIVIDLSHLSENGVAHVLDICQKPVICSHTNPKAMCGHRRNLPDVLLRGIALTGGIIGVVFYADYVKEGPCTITDVLCHVDHLMTLVGEDHIGIGPDFIDWAPDVILGDRYDRGKSYFPQGLGRVEDLPNFTAALEAKGMARGKIEKILGNNFLRVMKDTCN